MTTYFQKKTYDIQTLPFQTLAPHWHDDFEILYILSGRLEFHINHKTYLADSGEGFFLNAGQVHFARQYGTYPCRFLSFQISQSLLCSEENASVFQKYILPVTNSSSFCHLPLVQRIPWQKYILENIHKMIKDCEAENYGFEFKVHHYVNEIFYYIIRNLSSLPELTKKEQKDILRIKSAMSYLEKTYPEKHTLADIAESCQLSRSECSRLFRRILHVSPIEYLNQLRILHSLPLIALRQQPISSIAKEIGFSGGSYFSETFKKVMGCSPRDYY